MFVNRYGQIWKELIVEEVFMDRIQRCHVCEYRYGQILKELIVEEVFMDRIQRCHVCE